MQQFSRSDFGVYVAYGLFTIVVFLVALALLVTQTAVDPQSPAVTTFTVGFLLFMATYFAAMAVYVLLGRER